MPGFTFHSPTTAPEGSRPALAKATATLGFTPSLYAGLAESPTALAIYLQGADAFGKSALTAIEQQVVMLAVSVENRCEFCVAAHSTIARSMVRVPSEIVDALRDRRTLPDGKLQALAVFTRAIVAQRGWVSDDEVERFLAAGYTRAQVLDVIAGVSVKTLANYANHVLHTPVDAAFSPESWRAA